MEGAGRRKGKKSKVSLDLADPDYEGLGKKSLLDVSVARLDGVLNSLGDLSGPWEVSTGDSSECISWSTYWDCHYSMKPV